MLARITSILVITLVACGSVDDVEIDEADPSAGGKADDPDSSDVEYVMSLYVVAADGAQGSTPLLDDTAYQTPASLLAALATSKMIGSAHENQGLVAISHQV